jgi:cytoplasmic FMR1 interacting protein
MVPSRILLRYDWAVMLRTQNSGIFAMTPDEFMSLDDVRRQKSVPDKFSLNPTTNPRALKIHEVRIAHAKVLAKLFSLKSVMRSSCPGNSTIPPHVADELAAQLLQETGKAVALMRGLYCRLILVNAWKHSHPYGLRQLALDFPSVSENIQDIFEANKRDLSLLRAALSKMSASGAASDASPKPSSGSQVKRRRNMDYTPFEDAIACNFSDDERVVVIEIIACIKDIACALLDADFVSSTMRIFRSHFYRQVQEFALNYLTHPIRRAKKHNKGKAMTYLLQMRSLIAEWPGCEEPPKSPEVNGDKDTGITRKIDATHIPTLPSAAQMHLLIFMLDLQINRHAHEKGGLFHKDEIQNDHCKEFCRISNLVQSSLQMFNFHDAVGSVSNLAELWMHEYWLDLCQTSKDSKVPVGGTASQKTDALAFFPLRLSLPGSLLQVIDRKKVQYCDMHYHVLSVYSDIAAWCLSQRLPSFVFKEAKMEARLALFNIIRSQKRRTWNMARIQAFGSMLPLEFKTLMGSKELKGFTKCFSPQAAPVLRVDSIRIVSVVGVQIDVHAQVSALLSEMVHTQLKRGIRILEKKGLSGILEFKAMVSALRIMHEAICAATIALPPFQTYFALATDSSSPSSFISKVVKIVIISIVSDILPNFIFDSVTCVFKRAPGMENPNLEISGATGAALYGGPDLEKELERVRSAQEVQITRAHVDAMMELCGLHVPFIFHQLREYFETCLATLGKYVFALQEVFKVKHAKNALYTRAQMEQFGQKIAFAQLRSNLIPVLDYADLHTNDGIMYTTVESATASFSL